MAPRRSLSTTANEYISTHIETLVALPLQERRQWAERELFAEGKPGFDDVARFATAKETDPNAISHMLAFERRISNQKNALKLKAPKEDPKLPTWMVNGHHCNARTVFQRCMGKVLAQKDFPKPAFLVQLGHSEDSESTGKVEDKGISLGTWLGSAWKSLVNAAEREADDTEDDNTPQLDSDILETLAALGLPSGCASVVDAESLTAIVTLHPLRLAKTTFESIAAFQLAELQKMAFIADEELRDQAARSHIAKLHDIMEAMTIQTGVKVASFVRTSAPTVINDRTRFHFVKWFSPDQPGAKEFCADYERWLKSIAPDYEAPLASPDFADFALHPSKVQQRRMQGAKLSKPDFLGLSKETQADVKNKVQAGINFLFYSFCGKTAPEYLKYSQGGLKNPWDVRGIPHLDTDGNPMPSRLFGHPPGSWRLPQLRAIYRALQHDHLSFFRTNPKRNTDNDSDSDEGNEAEEAEDQNRLSVSPQVEPENGWTFESPSGGDPPSVPPIPQPAAASQSNMTSSGRSSTPSHSPTLEPALHPEGTCSSHDDASPGGEKSIAPVLRAPRPVNDALAEEQVRLTTLIRRLADTIRASPWEATHPSAITLEAVRCKIVDSLDRTSKSADNFAGDAHSMWQQFSNSVAFLRPFEALLNAQAPAFRPSPPIILPRFDYTSSPQIDTYIRALQDHHETRFGVVPHRLPDTVDRFSISQLQADARHFEVQVDAISRAPVEVTGLAVFNQRSSTEATQQTTAIGLLAHQLRHGIFSVLSLSWAMLKQMRTDVRMSLPAINVRPDAHAPTGLSSTEETNTPAASRLVTSAHQTSNPLANVAEPASTDQDSGNRNANREAAAGQPFGSADAPSGTDAGVSSPSDDRQPASSRNASPAVDKMTKKSRRKRKTPATSAQDDNAPLLPAKKRAKPTKAVQPEARPPLTAISTWPSVALQELAPKTRRSERVPCKTAKATSH